MNQVDCRRYYEWLDVEASKSETDTLVFQLPLMPEQEIMKRAVVVELPSPPPPLAGVQDNLTLTITKAQGPLKWKIDSWHDCPLVQIGEETYGVSVAIHALAGSDDYMLRAAVLNDPGQYANVSGLREERMVAVCKAAFEAKGWVFTPHYLLAKPQREIDGYATKNGEICIIQLKSTLRPQSAWDVYKRNADIIAGINHTAEVVQRLGTGTTGIVITDGYEGDYGTWKASMATGVAVGTLNDIDWIAENPRSAFEVLGARAGIENDAQPEELPERSFVLCGWTLRLLDQRKP